MTKINWLILGIIVIGLIYRLILSSNYNFIFNMDNARDMVDVREMVVLGNPRLIGQTTSIDGVFHGPFWYYLLAVPFILTGGDPYGSIIMEIILWAIGGLFLLYLVNKYYGILAMIIVSCLWVASNYIILGNQYAFNPNPILFLTPVFIFSLIKFIESAKWWYSAVCLFLSGVFFHFSVPIGIFMPIVYVLSIFFIRRELLLRKEQIPGVIIFIATFIPQFLFELRHNFFMTKALLTYQSTSHGDIVIVPERRVRYIFKSFYETLLPTFMNLKIFTDVSLAAFALILAYFIKAKRKIDPLTVISLLLIFVPLFSLIFIKIDILRWYLNEVMVASIILSGFVVYGLQKFSLGKIMAIILVVVVFGFTVKNISTYIQDKIKGSGNNSILRNEIDVVDEVYKQAGGKDFKVYAYLPSVIDYPYQYLFWWRGLKKYGFVPEDYAYSPGKPEYIKNKDRLPKGTNPPSSGLIFLIKEPDQIGQRHLWENQFRGLELLSTKQIGSIIVETRKEKFN